MRNITLAHILCVRSDSEITEGEKMLLNLKSLKINEQETLNMYAPLHLAVLCLKKEIVEILLNNPQVNLNIQDNKKNTPLHYAFSIKRNFKQKFEILKLFLQSSNKKLDLMPSNGLVFILFLFF